ncbi:MAG: S9 family peptidase [Terriglobales bacterium]
MRRWLLLLFVFSSVPLFSQAKHPFTFEEMMKLKRVEEPEVSPDGKWVLFAVVDVDLAANTKTPHVWIVPTAGGREKEIIADQDADRPRWAPDGKRFAFVSRKEAGSQIWIADFDGNSSSVTAVNQLTLIATETSGELWSPDGKNILFVSDVYPECQFDNRGEYLCNKGRLAEANNSKVKALIFDHLLYRHWNAYKQGRRSHLFLIPVPEQFDFTGADSSPVARSMIPRDLTPGDYDAPPFSLGGQDNYAFSPDGQEICYTSNHDPVPTISTNNDLWIVSVNGGPAKNITADNPASDSTPLYSPDGKYIAYRAQVRPGYEADRFRLMLHDRKMGEKKNLTENLDRWVDGLVWSLDSSTIYFTSGEKGESRINVVSVRDKKPPIYTLSARDAGSNWIPMTFATNDNLAITPSGAELVFTENSLEAPDGIYRLYLCPTRCDPPPPPTPLTHLNDAVLSQISMSPLESFWFPGAKGDKVEGFLVKPPNFDASKKYPVKFLIHGGPQGAWGDDWSYRWNPELFAAPTSSGPGYVVIMINFHGSTGYGQKFIDAINGDWGGAPFEDLMKGLDYAEKTYSFIDKDRECALGASYGGYMANWILGHTDRFKCIVSHDGMFNAESAWGTTEELWFNDWEFKGTPYDNREMYRKWSPHQYAKNFKTPTLVIHSQLDYRLDVSEGFQLFTTLQMEGVASKMLYFPDEGHWVLKPQNSQLWYKTVNDWVDQWIGK